MEQERTAFEGMKHTSFDPLGIAKEVSYLYGVVRVLRVPGSAMDDLVQDVAVWALANPEKYDPNRATVRTWLYGVARNAARVHREHCRRFVPTDDLATEEAPGLDVEAAILIATGIGAIDENLQKLFVAHCVKGETLEELSEKQGLSERILRRKLERAWRQFRRAVHHERAEQERRGIIIPLGLVTLLDMASTKGTRMVGVATSDYPAFPPAFQQPSTPWKGPAFFFVSGAAVGGIVVALLGPISCYRPSPSPPSTPSTVLAVSPSTGQEPKAPSPSKRPAIDSPPAAPIGSPPAAPFTSSMPSIEATPVARVQSHGDDSLEEARNLLRSAQSAIEVKDLPRAFRNVREYDARFGNPFPDARRRIGHRLGR